MRTLPNNLHRHGLGFEGLAPVVIAECERHADILRSVGAHNVQVLPPVPTDNGFSRVECHFYGSPAIMDAYNAQL